MTSGFLGDEDAINALRQRVADKFAADLKTILDRVNQSHAGRPVDPVLDEIADQVRGLGVEPDRRELRPHAVLISERRYDEDAVGSDPLQPPMPPSGDA
jgi:pyruvate-formate lyase-activating enzyme